MDTTNPTLDPAALSKTIVQETIRPDLAAYADDHDLDADDVARGGKKQPPLVMTAFPDPVLYPHIIVDEESASGSKIDERHGFLQWDFTVSVEIHGRTPTEMFAIKDGVRGYFSTEQDALRSAGFADIEISGGPTSWDATADVASWEFSVDGLVHTHTDG